MPTTDKIDIVIDRLPLSLNKMLGLHWSDLHPNKELWRMLMYHAWHTKGKPMFCNPVKIHYTIYFPDKRQRDFDNYMGGTKFITDALRSTFITRDDWRWLKSISISFAYGKAATHIHIEEVKEDAEQ